MPDRKDEEQRRSAADATREGEKQDWMARGYARAEQRNQAVRESLEPLGPGERPGAVTVGAVFSALIAIIFWASLGVSVIGGVEIDGRRPDPVQLTFFAGVMTAMAIGMWQAKYWAVLGFQLLMVLFLLAAVAGLLTAQTIPQAEATTVLIGVVGVLFYRMIRAMARIQMPERRPPR